jgi:hypothetical protein
MSRGDIKGEVKQEITSDFILQLYEEMKQMPDGEEKNAKRAVVEVLSEHLGEWLVLEEGKNPVNY